MPGVDSELLKVLEYAAKNVHIAMSSADGRKRSKAVGSAFTLFFGESHCFVTAEHVVLDAPRPVIGLSKNRGERWPLNYYIPAPVQGSAAPSCDIAYFFGKDTRGGCPAFELSDVVPSFPSSEGMRAFAIGHPVSRAKSREDTKYMHTETSILGGRLVGDEIVRALGYDPQTFLGMTYDPQELTTFAGERTQGPFPRGMSGGVLLAVIPVEPRGDGRRLGIALLGVLSHYCRPPNSVIIAARIDCLLHAAADGVDLGKRRYEPRAV